MKLFQICKDGGPESTVWAHVLIEVKSLFSIMLLRFEDGTRDAYHSHAFDCVSWVLKGELHEFHHPSTKPNVFDRLDIHTPSLWPVITRRTTYHKVKSVGRTWVLTFRGPWAKTWKETVGEKEITLTNGRKEIS